MTKKQILSNNRTITGIMILVVVAYHVSLMPSGRWYVSADSIFAENKITDIVYTTIIQLLNNLHVPVLFVISGYNFCHVMTTTDHYATFNDFLERKVSRLVVPLIFVTTCWVLPLYAWLHLYPIGYLLQASLLGIAQLWYLMRLLMASVVIRLTWKVSKTIGMQVAIIVIIGILVSMAKECPQEAVALLYFTIGVFMYKNNVIEDLSKRPLHRTYAVMIILISIAFRLAMNICRPQSIYAPMLPIYAPSVFYLMQTSKAVPKLDQTKFMDFIKKNSYCIYLFHEQIICICLVKLSDISIGIVMLIAFISALTISLMISKILHKYPLTKILIGERVISNKQKSGNERRNCT